MPMQIYSHIKTPLLQQLALDFYSRMKDFVTYQSFTNIKQLTSNLSTIKEEEQLKKTIIIIDVEDALHIEYIKQIKSISNLVKLIAMGYPKDNLAIKSFYTNGYNSFFDISISANDFINSINALKIYPYFLSPDKVSEFIQEYVQLEAKKQIQNLPISEVQLDKISDSILTSKEKEVIFYLLKGYTYKKIAQILGISAFAVNQRTKTVYKKCNVKSRSELSYLLYTDHPTKN